jgi:hypothetical protein
MPHGSIKVEWEKRDGIFELKTEVPDEYVPIELKKKENGIEKIIYKRNSEKS